jgi:hypothetical protein
MSQELQPKIVWEKWRDPYGQDQDITIDEIAGWGLGDESEVNNEQSLAELEQNVGLQSEPSEVYKRPLQIIATPMGVMPLTEYTTPGKIFNFWTCHTNFNITPLVKQLIEHVDGVETLDIYTRYRMKIGFGKTFNTNTVKQNIQKLLYETLSKQQRYRTTDEVD